MEVKASCYPAELLQPREQPLYFPSALVTPQRPAVLGSIPLPVRLVRRDHLNALTEKLRVERVGVVSLIANQPFRPLGDKTLKESFADKGDFLRRSTLRVVAGWTTSSVCHSHELRPFTPLGLSPPPPPFLATMNVPSMKHSLRSISPRSRRSSASASRRRRSVPSRDHCWNRRWQGWYGRKPPRQSRPRAPRTRNP